MKIKIALLIITIFVSRNLFSQKDSIVNFFDNKGIITKDKEKARSFEIITKKEASLWLVRKYRKNGKIYNYSYSPSKEKKIKIGSEVFFNKYGKKIGVVLYDRQGNKHGKSQRWFDNDTLNTEALYLAGKKEGIWKAYHYNGKLAARIVFKNDTILKTTHYNEKGKKVVANENVLKETKPIFKGGNKKYVKKLKKLIQKITFKVKGKIIVNYVIDTNGAIKDVTIDEKTPKKLKKEIIAFFENLKGWKPAIDLNRKIPCNYHQPLNFRH